MKKTKQQIVAIKKLPTVSVFVSAYNEEGNIKQFLNSVLLQKECGYMLDRIIVVSDGSSDGTVSVVKRMRSNKITIVEKKKRFGKSLHLTQWYQKIESEIIVQSDADVVFANDHVIANLIKPILLNKKVAMCGGNPLPVEAGAFTEKAINVTVGAYAKLRHRVRKGNNVLSADGRLLALRGSFAKRVSIPEDMIANDAFAYFSCLSLGNLYRFVPEAVVKFRSPVTLRDHIRQNTRFLAAPIRMKKYFSHTLVEKEYSIPSIILLRVYLTTFIRNPLLCMFIYCMNKLCRVNAFSTEQKLDAKWAMASTTKRLSL